MNIHSNTFYQNFFITKHNSGFMQFNVKGKTQHLHEVKDAYDSRELIDEHKEKEKLDRILTDARKKDLEKQGYRFVGNHSAIKVCDYTHKMIKGKDVCYKCTFYGINSYRCIQMTPVMNSCNLRCKWCWRDIEYTSPTWIGPIDDPDFIAKESVKQHVKILIGYKGNKKINPKIIEKIQKPKHVAISLFGEATNYPMLPELISSYHDLGMTTFLVTNGTNPEVMEKLKQNPPTQLYVTLPAPDQSTFMKACRPLLRNAWERILQSLAMLKDFNCRRTIRFTLANGLNMKNPNGYAEILENVDADFYELKGYVWVGHSQNRLQKHQMPTHDEIKEFANKISRLTGLQIVSEKAESRAVLLMKQDKKERFLMLDSRSKEQFCMIS